MDGVVDSSYENFRVCDIEYNACYLGREFVCLLTTLASSVPNFDLAVVAPTD